MSTYTGTTDGRRVLKDGSPLLPRRSQKVMNHSPDGFNWGYGGSGPAQLALALLLEELPENDARIFYQDFKWDVIAGLDMDAPWTVTSEDVQQWLKAKGYHESITT